MLQSKTKRLGWVLFLFTATLGLFLTVFLLKTTSVFAQDAGYLNGCNLQFKTVTISDADNGFDKFGTGEISEIEMQSASSPDAAEVGKTVLIAESNEDCRLRFVYPSVANGLPNGTVELKSTSGAGNIAFTGKEALNAGEFTFNGEKVNIGNTAAATTFFNSAEAPPLPDVVPVRDPVPEEEEEERPTTCVSVSGSSFGWVICPVIEHTQRVLDWIFFSLLGPLVEFNPSDAQGLRDVWSGFVTIANLIFVIAFFVVIYSAATGSILSAYDVRKLLPRLFIIAILVQLSFFLSTFALTVTNEVGSGVRDLMLFPVKNQPAISAGGLPTIETGENVANNVVDAGLNLTSDVVDVVGGLGSGIVMLVIMLLMVIYSLSGILLLAGVFIVRDVALVCLIVISPVAFALAVLPGTENYFRLWWKWFFGLLSIFPILAALLASGQLVASVFTSSGSFAPPVAFVVATIAFFLPYFLSVKILKFAGQAAGTLTGVFNSLSTNKGKALDKIRNNEGFKRFGAKAGAGRGLDEKYTRLNKGLGVAFGGRGRLSPTRSGRARAASRRESAARLIEADETKIYASGLDDEVAAAIARGGDEGSLLRTIVNDRSAPTGKRMAAAQRMIINKDYEGLRGAFEGMAKSGNANLIQRIKSDSANVGELGKNAPHLLKTDYGQASNGTRAASGLDANGVASMSGGGLADLMQTTVNEYNAATTQKEKDDAEAALANLVTRYREADANDNVIVGPATHDAFTKLNSADDIIIKYTK